MKILVTGAAGFIGSHTAERLKVLGHEVVGLDNYSDYYDISLKEQNTRSLLNKGVEVEKIDLCKDDLASVITNEIDFIFHFAAQPGISATSSFHSYVSNNIFGTQRMLDILQTLKTPPFFVNIATSSIYGLQATLKENQAPLPASWYGVTKLAAEQLVLSYIRRNLLEGTSFRLYSVYGPRERPDKLYTRLIDCGLNDKPFPLYEGSEKHLRSFTYVQDIVDGIVSAIPHRQICNGEVFNLGTEEENTTAIGIATTEAILGKKIMIKNEPPRAGDQFRTKANIDKARALLHYNPKTKLQEGLKAQVAWFKENFK